MKASELRIGNYVYYNNENKSIGIISTLVNDLVPGLDYCQIDHVINKKHWCINLEPIPLTEEWLLKFGLEIKNNYAYDKASLGFFVITFGEKFYWKSFELKYVHQLQNLYFSLSREELILKEL